MKRHNWKHLYLRLFADNHDTVAELKAARLEVESLNKKVAMLESRCDGEHEEVERLRAVRTDLRARLETEVTRALRAEGARDVLAELVAKMVHK